MYNNKFKYDENLLLKTKKCFFFGGGGGFRPSTPMKNKV